MISINSNTRQFIIPGSDLVFGVEHDSGSERKDFTCPRYVGNQLDIASCFVRINYRNANGHEDSYLVNDIVVDGNNVTFSWLLSKKVTEYKGQIRFVMCVVGPDLKLKWHTTLGVGQVYEGLEPDAVVAEEGTADVVAQLIAMVNEQTALVRAEGSTQIQAVKDAAEAAEAASVAEIEAKGVNTLNSIPADYTALSEAVDSLARSRAGAVVCETAGSVIAVNDASNDPMQGIRIFGRSTQDGAPSPDAPVEIKSVENPVVTVAGKNLIPNLSAYNGHGITIAPNPDGSVTVNGKATNSLGYKGESVYLPAGTYTLKCNQVLSDGTWLSISNGPLMIFPGEDERTYQLESGVHWLYFYINSGVELNGFVLDAQLELGDVATEHEPYTGHTVETTHTIRGIPVTSGGNYTDENGQQWICDEVDLERGVYVQRLRRKTLAAEDIAYTGTGFFEFGTYAFTTIRDAKIMPTDAVVISDKLLGIRADYRTGSGYDDKYRCYSQDGVVYLRFPAGTGEKTLAECREAFTGVTVQYALAVPIETHLSETEIAAYRAIHSNYPNTTVLNSAGAHMVVKYAADTKLYIDNKIAALIGG